MNPETQRVRDVFVAAVKLPPERWEAFLEETCAGDDELRRQVSDLLREHQQAGSFSPPTRLTWKQQAAQFVKLRYFAGLTIEEAAEMVGLSRSAACEHWAYARAWLHRRLRAAGDGARG